MKKITLVLALALAAGACTPAQIQTAATIAKRAAADILLPYVRSIVSRGQLAIQQVETKYQLGSPALPPDEDRDRAFAALVMSARADLDYVEQLVADADFTRDAVDRGVAMFRGTYEQLLVFLPKPLKVRARGQGELLMGAAPDASVLVLPAPGEFALPPPGPDEAPPPEQAAGGENPASQPTVQPGAGQ